MNFIRTFALLVGITVLFTACDKGADQASVAIKANTNPLLAYVPAETAYVFADLEPVPEAITDAYIQRFQPVLDVATEKVSQFQADYANGKFEGNDMARFASVVLNELGGELTPESLEALGIDTQAHHAAYAMGVFPVIRFGLGDSQSLRDAIGRIQTEMGFALTEKSLNGDKYWSISQDDMPLGVYIAILDRHLAVSAFPTGAEDVLLAAFLGQEMPTQSMAAANTLATMNSKKGYTAYGSGILDLQKLSEEFLNPDSDTRRYLGPDMNFGPGPLSDTCVAEIRSLVAKAPRMTAGSITLTASEIAMRYELEMESSLANGLVTLVSDIPATIDDDSLFSASLALNIGKLRAFMLEKANAIVTSPYQCEKLRDINQQAGDLLTQLNIPMPPMVNNLLGLRVRMDEFDPTTTPPTGRGLVALHVDKPEMFVGMASMMVPGFEALDLANQTEPVRIPKNVLPMENLDVYALMGDKAIGVSVGKQGTDDLQGFLNSQSHNGGAFMSLSYDMARQMEIQAAMRGRLDIDTGGSDSSTDEFSEAIMASYTDMLGRSRVDMRFTGDGLVIDSKLNFR